jgi:colanic acid biosynthesis glycosyl transferase WcaI
MRILFFNQFFWPDSSATSQLLTDLATELNARGHQVSVICTAGGYAPSASGDLPGIRIERVKSLPFVRGRIGRLLSYLSFYPFALLRAFSLPRQDLIVSLTTPPLISLIGSIVKAVRGSNHVIWEMDLYPDVAVELNYIKSGGLIHRITGSVADFSRRHCDAIIALGDCMKRRLISRGIDARKIVVADNWADSKTIRPYPRLHHQDQLVLLYSGNLGLAHDLDTITGAILRLREDRRFRFVFVGGGSRRSQLADLVKAHGLDAVKLLPYAPREDLGRSLSAGDIGLVTQLDASCGTVVPSKVYGILASGRPLLFIGPEDSTPARIVERFNCGWSVRCGDVDALTELLHRLVEAPAEVEQAGQRARLALLQNFDLPIGVDRIIRTLEHASRTTAQDHPDLTPEQKEQDLKIAS